jgi:hypothetical protein
MRVQACCATAESVAHANGKARPLKGKKIKAKAKTAKTNSKLVDSFGFRKGSLKSRAAAMYASKRGATLNEIKTKLKSTQFNVLNQLRKQGYKVKKAKEKGVANRQATRYSVVVR